MLGGEEAHGDAPGIGEEKGKGCTPPGRRALASVPLGFKGGEFREVPGGRSQ